MTSYEKEVVERFRRLNGENQDNALAIIRALHTAQNTSKNAFYKKFGGIPEIEGKADKIDIFCKAGYDVTYRG